MTKKILSPCFISFVLQSTVFCGNTDTWNGSAYHNNSAPQYTTALETLKEITFNKSDNVLDIGCGSGDITAHLIAPLVPNGQVFGIDMSNSMIAFAQNTYKDIPNSNFAVVDVRTWPTDDKKYDCVVSFNAFHFIENLSTVFISIAQRLKPEGILLFATGHKKNFYENSIAAVTASPKWVHYFKNSTMPISFTHDKESIEKVLKSAGFRPLVIKSWHQTVRFENKEKFATFTRAWIYGNAYLQQLPANLRADIVADIIEQSPIQINQDGSVEYSTPILIVKAVKIANQ